VTLSARLPADWPQRGHSRSVRTGAVDWHVQVGGQGPTVLLLHGTGGSAHSWAGLLPSLLPHATVVAPDLLGHGFTTGAPLAELTLPRMARALGGLLQALKLPPATLVVGHSAGAALALRLALDAEQPPRAVLGFAPSLLAPPAAYTQWLAPLLNPVATSRPVARLMAAVAGPSGLIDLLLGSTGSQLTPAQRAPYRRLFADRAHVRGAVGFMAVADLPALNADCARLHSQVAFVLGAGDRWIPEKYLRPVIARHLPHADVQAWPGGHLVHEERPAQAAERVLALLASATRASSPVPGADSVTVAP
jgi:magnesium chelatase accessory protein